MGDNGNRGANPLVLITDQIWNREEQFKAALPTHINVEKFRRVLLTAIQNNPRLMQLDRASFFNASMRAAQDGLLPDGREGAIVEFSGKAQWMPMILGIRKKARNSGEIVSWEAHVVYQNDEFDYALGDEPFIKHKPTLDEPGPPIAAYSVAVLKSGEKSREVMTITQIEKVRSISKSKNGGPWTIWWDEMARKTVARRHSKSLPMSTDLDTLIRRDDEMYDLNTRNDNRNVQGGNLGDRMAALAASPERGAASQVQPAPEPVDHDPETGEVAQDETEAGNGHVSDGTCEEADANGDEGPSIDFESPEYKTAFDGALKGLRKGLTEAIKSDPVKMANWNAGYEVGTAERARGR